MNRSTGGAKTSRTLKISRLVSQTSSLALGSVFVACVTVTDPGPDDSGFADDGVGGSAVGGAAGALQTGGVSGSQPTGGATTGGIGPTGGISGTGFGGAGAGGANPAGAGFGGAGSGGTGFGGAGSGGTAGSGVAGTMTGGAGNGGVGTGGSIAGQGGTAGTSVGGAGSGGTSGSAGKGGAAGSGGSAGKAGSGGSGGSGGSAGKGGSGGSGGACQTPTAPSNFQETINLTWQEMTGGFEGRTGARPRSASVTNFRNTILDQIAETNGTLNFCVRWESTTTVSASMRDSIAQALTRGVNEWFSKLVGHNCWPYGTIPVKVVGWATRDRNLLQWSDATPIVYVNDIRENAPQCAEACGRFFHQQAGYTYPQCQGGAANHYDMSLWLTEGMSGGAGGDWGQRVGRAYFTDSVNAEHQHIWLHEFGHGFGFPDYYNWAEWTSVASPNSVMVAGRASLVTDWDTWMFRHTYNQLKSRL